MKKNLAGRYKITNRGTIIVNNIRITKSEYSRYKELNRLVENKRRRLERKGDVYFGKQVRSLRIYETKAEFKAQVRKLERYLQPNYVMTRDKILFENYKQKVRDVFADEKMKRQMITSLNKMGVSGFIKNYKAGNIEGIEFLYTSKKKYMSEYDAEIVLKQVQKVLTSLAV